MLAGPASAHPVDPRCEYLVNPLGIDQPHPRLSWRLQAEDPNQRGIRQTAYQGPGSILPDLLAENRADLWDSGKVESDQSIQLEYAGRPLVSRQYCYWKVRIRD